MVSVEPFIYGNIKVIENTVEYPELYPKILKELESSIDKLAVINLWNIAENLRIIQSKYINGEFVEFVNDIFKILDKKFTSNYTSVDTNNVVTVKVFIAMNIKYSVICMESFDDIKDSDVISLYYKYFFKEDMFSGKFQIIHNTSLVSDITPWAPRWSLSYNGDTVEIPHVDVMLDNFILFPSIIYNPTDPVYDNILEFILFRMDFLKENAPSYLKLLESKYLHSFSKYVYEKYPFCEVVKFYGKLREKSNSVYCPELLKDLELTEESIFMSLLSKNIRSYFLGFPYLTGGTISSSMEKERLKTFLEDRKEFYQEVKNRNNEIIKTKILNENVKNAEDNGDYLNVLFTPISEYNIDDVMVILSGGVTFMFTYPEYETIVKQGTNSYTREELEFTTMYMMRCTTEMKKTMEKYYISRGFVLSLNATMEEDFVENLEKAKTYSPLATLPPQNNFHLNFGPLINDFLFGQMRI